MSTEIVKKENVEIAVVDETLLKDFAKISRLNDTEAKQFLAIAKSFNLNPFKREIYVIPYGQGERRTCSILVGYEVYIKRAERTGLLDGWESSYNKDEESASVTIYRKDWGRPFTHTVYAAEVAQQTPIWKKMPIFMLKKVAIAQGFRMCFPDELGGLPYTDAEESEVSTSKKVESKTIDVSRFTSVEEKVKPSEYVPKILKYKGVKLSDIRPQELSDYCVSITKEMSELTGDAKEFIDISREYLRGLKA